MKNKGKKEMFQCVALSIQEICAGGVLQEVLRNINNSDKITLRFSEGRFVSWLASRSDIDYGPTR